MPTTLPASAHLPVEHLAASFGDVTNSYKFYWLLAILDHLKETGETTMSINHLVARMVAGVWHPSNYFRLSFGKQDRLGMIALAIRAEGTLPANAAKTAVVAAALSHAAGRTDLAQKVRSLAAYVPYRFLRPFFSGPLRGITDAKVNAQVRRMADERFAADVSPCLYRFVNSGAPAIELHPRWANYLQVNLVIVTGYCLWHLTNYLQKNNPNVPNIASKLFEPGQRNLRSARRFWNTALAELGAIRCVYSGKTLAAVDSLDHFLPWSFVAHDLLWNIIPTSKVVNSAKNDQLPQVSRYFDAFAHLQYQALQVVAATAPESLLDDYILLLKAESINDIRLQSFDFFYGVLRDTIAPQMQIAKNMGFTADWSYSPQ
jgi:hypothetical protein